MNNQKPTAIPPHPPVTWESDKLFQEPHYTDNAPWNSEDSIEDDDQQDVAA